MTDTVSYASRLNDDGSLEAMLRDHRREGIANCSRFWTKAERLKKFAGRDQWPKAKPEDDDPGAKKFRATVPEVARVLATFSGRQMMQRFEREYIPRHQGAARFAETMTKVDKAIMQAADAEQVESAAFKDGPGIQGVSWVRWYVDEVTGPSPMLRIVDVPIWSMMWPATRELNLRDRAWHRWGSWWPQREVKERWPDSYEKIRTLIGTNSWTQAEQQHGQSSRIPWAGQAGNKPLAQADFYDPKGRSLWIEYEEWKELIVLYAVARPRDPMMSYADALALRIQEGEEDPIETVELDLAGLREFRKQHAAIHDGEQVPEEPKMVVRRPRMVYRYAYLCGDEVLETDDLPVGIFTFTAMAAERIELPNETLYIGLMEDLVDAQRMNNYMLSALVRDLQINPKGTLFVEQGLFRDKNAALTAFTSPGGVVEVPRGRMSQTTGRPYEFVAGGTQPYRSMVESMFNFYRESIPRLAGFNPAALGQLGSDLRRISGQVVRAVQDAAMVSNAERFDSLRLYRREGGRIFFAFMRLLYDPEDLVDFIGEEDAYEEVEDPMTGMPAVDEFGQPVRRLAIPPKDMWFPDQWKEIAVEEVAPSDDELTALWDTLQTQVQLLIQPMPDTGKPLFGSEDLVKVLPKIPAATRQKMLLRIRREIRQQQMALAAQQSQPAPEEGASAPAPQPVAA